MTRFIIPIIAIILSVSCLSSEKQMVNLINDVGLIDSISVSNVIMKAGFEEQLIDELKNAKELPPTKFAKKYRIIIYKSNRVNDTMRTNGQIVRYKNNWYELNYNVIEKHKLKEY